MKRLVIWAVALSVAATTGSATAGQEMRSISHGSAPSLQPRKPGEIFRYEGASRPNLIRSIDSQSDRVTSIDRLPAPPPAPAASPVRRVLSERQQQQAALLANALDPTRQQLQMPRPTSIENRLVSTLNAVGRRPASINGQMPAWATSGKIPIRRKPVVLFSREKFFASSSRAVRLHGVEEALVRTIIHVESAYRPAARSHAGAQGLMQLMPATARRFGVSNSYDPEQNIEGGTRYLAWLLERYDGNVTLAAAAYNAGEGAVDKYGGVPPYSETRNYVLKVTSLLPYYRSLIHS